MFSIGNYMLSKYMYRFKGTPSTGIENLLLFNEGMKLLFRPPVVPLIFYIQDPQVAQDQVVHSLPVQIVDMDRDLLRMTGHTVLVMLVGREDPAASQIMEVVSNTPPTEATEAHFLLKNATWC